MKLITTPGVDYEIEPRQWTRFIKFCRELGHGEIAVLKIQDGVPVMAESVTKKIKFS